MDGSARVGRILELADGLAADVGYRHAVGGYKQGVGISVATASIYSLVLNGREFVDSEDIFLRAYVTRVGSSSMEVCIEMEQVSARCVLRRRFAQPTSGCGFAVLIPMLLSSVSVMLKTGPRVWGVEAGCCTRRQGFRNVVLYAISVSGRRP